MEIKFAENLKMLNKESGFSQYKLAELLKTSQRIISHLENGETESDLQTLIEISVIFDVTIDFLVGKTEY